VTAPLLEVTQLSVRRKRREGWQTLVHDFSVSVTAGTAIGVVGESGSGKSLSLWSLLRLLPEGMEARAVRMRYDGRELQDLPQGQLADLRGRQIGLVFQDSLSALDPLRTIGGQIAEVLLRHRIVPPADVDRRVLQLLSEMGIPDVVDRARQYPHELSGGMRQRVCIAIALAAKPRLLMLDEPTTALDATVQAAIVELIRQRQRAESLALLWVTHDLALLAGIADRVVVLCGGRVMEDAPTERLFAAPAHPYARALLASARGEGSPGSTAALAPDGCAFAPRCPLVVDRCRSLAPPLLPIDEVHRVACWAHTPTWPTGTTR
jgi:peptide/nickel transport system ATP-binding protein